jgi:hypothetical protein
MASNYLEELIDARHVGARFIVETYKGSVSAEFEAERWPEKIPHLVCIRYHDRVRPMLLEPCAHSTRSAIIDEKDRERFS